MLSVNIPTHCHNPNFDNQGQSGIPFWQPKKKKLIAIFTGDKYWCNRSEQIETLHEFMLANKSLIFALQMEKYLASNEPNCISIALHASKPDYHKV